MIKILGHYGETKVDRRGRIVDIPRYYYTGDGRISKGNCRCCGILLCGNRRISKEEDCRGLKLT